jgi:hypothetical protein
MIAQQDAAQSIAAPSVPRTWQDVCARAARLVWNVVRTPPLPWAALAEAQLLLGMIASSAKEDGYAPDAFSTEMPFLNDSWPRED